MCEFYCSTNLQVPETRPFYTLNVFSHSSQKPETRLHLEGEIFCLTCNDFDGDIREGHINTSPGMVSYDIPYSDAMGYDLVKLKHFDMQRDLCW